MNLISLYTGTLIAALLSFRCYAGSSPKPFDLWPSTPPGNKGQVEPERDMTKASDRPVAGKPVIRLGNVSKPTLTIYPARGSSNTGTAVLVCPGGAYRILAIDLEGEEICEWLNSIGVTAGLLKYRVPKQEGDDSHVLPLEDAQRALSLLRHSAKEWGGDAKRIGIMGFSAGGHLTANLCNNYSDRKYSPVDGADAESCRPDFAMLIYPAYLLGPKPSLDLAPEMNITSNTPPTFITMTMDDPLGIEGATRYALALHQVNVPAELHIYPEGGHGYGLRPDPKIPVTGWPKLAEAWMRNRELLERGRAKD